MNSRAVQNESLEASKGAGSFLSSALQDAFRLRGCPICRAVSAAERQSIWSFLHEGMMAPDVRNNFLDHGGFCPRHFWMAQDIEEKAWPAGGFGLAILCQQLLVRAEQRLAEAERTRSLKRRPALFRREGKTPRLIQREECLFCLENGSREKMYASVLEESMQEADFQFSFSDNPLCLSHAILCLNSWQPTRYRRWLQRSLQEYISELKADAREFIDKHDYRRREEAAGREGNVVNRTRDFLLGIQGG